jgi:hypothetical protein
MHPSLSSPLVPNQPQIYQRSTDADFCQLKQRVGENFSEGVLFWYPLVFHFLAFVLWEQRLGGVSFEPVCAEYGSDGEDQQHPVQNETLELVREYTRLGRVLRGPDLRGTQRE